MAAEPSRFFPSVASRRGRSTLNRWFWAIVEGRPQQRVEIEAWPGTARSGTSPSPRPPALGHTLRRQLDPRSNAIGFLRLLFASVVVVDHCFPLGGFRNGRGLSFGPDHQDLGLLAVYGFFLLSGLLIARSAERTRGVIRFFWHRALRIFPAYWVALAVVAYGFALLAYAHEHRGVGGFLAGDQSPFGFVRWNVGLQLRQYNIDHELGHTPFAGSGLTQTWNGSLYTLGSEFSCYIVVGLLAIFGVVRRVKAIPLAAACACFVISLLAHSGHAVSNVPFLSDQSLVNFAFFFFAGAALNAYADRLPMNDIVGGLASAVALGCLVGGGWLIVGRLAFCLAIPWLAIRLPFRTVGVKRDLSYGVYIYAFPVQQLLSEYALQARGLLAYVSLSLVGAYALAWVSWYCVERPALRAKSWTPSFGRRWTLASSCGINRADLVPQGRRTVPPTSRAS